MDHTTLANAKQWLGISSDTDDALLSRLISAASPFIETYLNRSLGSQVYVEVRHVSPYGAQRSPGEDCKTQQSIRVRAGHQFFLRKSLN